MGKIGYLVGKSIDTFKEEGATELVKKSGRYIKGKVVKPKNVQQVKDILFINGCYLPHPSRYRVDHQMEQLNSNNVSCDSVFYENLTLDLEKYYRGFVFFRCPITDTVKEFIKKAKDNNKTVFYDIDDLVFDKEYTKTIKHLDTMSKEELDMYYDGVKRMGDTLKLCDYATTTTETLAKELKKYVKDVYVNRNVASERMCELSLKAQKKVKREENKVILGYLSGSITHNADFELILPAITKIMSEKDNVYLKVVGLLDIPKELEPYKERILTAPFVDWMKLPEIIASIDINLAPLEDSLFNEAKSENKWTEAALVKVPTIASNIGAFKIINDNVDGILVKNTADEWYKKLTNLIENKDLQDTIANNAFNRKWFLGEDYNKTMYNPKVNKEFLVKNGNGSNTYRNMRSNKSYLNNEKDNSYNSYNGYENDLTERNYRRQNSFSDFNRNLSIRNNNLNEIKENENYQKNIKQKIHA